MGISFATNCLVKQLILWSLWRADERLALLGTLPLSKLLKSLHAKSSVVRMMSKRTQTHSFTTQIGSSKTTHDITLIYLENATL